MDALTSEVILQTHPLEFQNARQATKIAYLQQEIKYLQDTIKDLEQLSKINKEALKLITNQSSPEKTQLKNVSQEDTASSTFDNRSSPQINKGFHALYENLQEENAKLLEVIKKLKKERSIAQSKALLSEQICEEVQRHETEVMAELQGKILELRKMVQDKEFFIQQLEKVKPFPYQDGVVVKFRDVMSATEQNLKLQEELNNYNNLLMKLAKEHNKLQLEKEELARTNTDLSNELVKLKTMMTNPVNNKFSLKNLLGASAKSFLNRSYHQRHKSPINSPIIIPDDSDSNSYANVCGATTKPSKFKQQETNNKPNTHKVSSPYISTNPLFDMKLLDRISQLETELDKAKKKLSVEMINNNNLSDEISELRRTCTQMMATNEILCKSNKRYQEKWDSVLYAIDFYKAFFHKYMNIISIRKPSTRNAIVEIPNLEALKKINEALVQELELKPLTENKIKNQDIVLPKEDYITPVKNKERLNEYGFTKDQSKAYLLSLAKELASKSDLYKARLERSKNVHRKRSMSNALDYVYERRKLTLKPIQEENPEDRKFRKEHRKCSLNYNPTERIPDNLKGGLNMNKRITSHTQKILLNEAKRSEGHLSFSIDIEELDRVKATEASFISTNDIFHTVE